MKKSYISPEFEYVKLKLETVICTSFNAETPIDDIIEYDDGDDA